MYVLHMIVWKQVPEPNGFASKWQSFGRQWMSLCETSAEFHFSKNYVPPKLVSSTEHELTESHQLHEDYCDMECLWGSCLPGWEESWQTCLKESWTALLSLSPENTYANMLIYQCDKVENIKRR